MNSPSDQQPQQPQSPRNPPAMLRRLGRHLAWHQRTRVINDALERQLGALDGFSWHIERDVSIASVTIPLIVFGPSGLFLLQASRGYWTDEDVALMADAARTLGAVLSDYPDPVRPAIVVLGESSEERHHFTGKGYGPCCVVGDGRLLQWLHRWDDHGFSEADIALLRDEADPAQIRESPRRLVPRGSGHDGDSLEDFYFPG
jgi:hypothetical protein